MSKKRKSKKNKKKVRFTNAPIVEKGGQVGQAQAKPKRLDFIFKKLYAKEAAGLYQLITILPFFIASWIAGGFIIERIEEFFIITLIMIVGSYSIELEKNKKLNYKKEFTLISSGILVALLLWFSSFTSNLPLTLMLAATVVIQRLRKYVDYSSVKNVLLNCISMILIMSLYSWIGIVSQIYVVNPSLEWQYMIFGFVPGTLLAGSLVAKKSQVFLNNSWQRFSEAKNKKGEDVKRPGGLTRLFSLFLILGPAIPTISTPLEVFPAPFLATAVAFYFVPNILEDYLNETQADAIIALRTANLALGMAILMLIIGIFIRLGVV